MITHSRKLVVFNSKIIKFGIVYTLETLLISKSANPDQEPYLTCNTSMREFTTDWYDKGLTTLAGGLDAIIRINVHTRKHCVLVIFNTVVDHTKPGASVSRAVCIPATWEIAWPKAHHFKSATHTLVDGLVYDGHLTFTISDLPVIVGSEACLTKMKTEIIEERLGTSMKKVIQYAKRVLPKY